jgi:DNA-directed RNA polymerase subunit RPC12/RpoP
MTDPLREFTCHYCLAPEAAHFRFDKHGRPYVVCDACGTRVFMKSLRCLRGPALVTPLVEAMMKRLTTNADDYAQAEQTAESFVQAMKARLAGVANARPPATTTITTEQDHARPAVSST